MDSQTVEYNGQTVEIVSPESEKDTKEAGNKASIIESTSNDPKLLPGNNAEIKRALSVGNQILDSETQKDAVVMEC